MVDQFNPPPPRTPGHDADPMAGVDHKAMYELLLLEEKLRGHPHLSASKALVDQALVNHNAKAKVAADKIAFDRAARVNAEAAARAHDAAILAAAGPAHARMDAIEADKAQVPLDQKTIHEADAAAKARADREAAWVKQRDEEARRAVGAPIAPGSLDPERPWTPGTPGSPVTPQPQREFPRNPEGLPHGQFVPPPHQAPPDGPVVPPGAGPELRDFHRGPAPARPDGVPGPSHMTPTPHKDVP